jgi:hypothetical protein
MTFNKLLTFIISVLLLCACQQEVDPTIENINAIFQTKDFSIEFIVEENRSHRLSFRDDFMSYFSNAATQRKTISYHEAALVNTFVQNKFSKQDTTISATQQLLIYNDTKKVILNVPDYEQELKVLLEQLKLNYVPTQKK